MLHYTIQTHCRNSDGYELCSSYSWFVFVLLWKLIFLKLLTQLPDTWMNLRLSTILTLKEWSLEFILLNCNWTKLILLIRGRIFRFAFLISDGFVSSIIYDKRDDFDLGIVNFSFQDGDVPRASSYDVYMSQLIQYARMSSHLADLNAHKNL